jgi:hypothetical protein
MPLASAQPTSNNTVEANPPQLARQNAQASDRQDRRSIEPLGTQAAVSAHCPRPLLAQREADVPPGGVTAARDGTREPRPGLTALPLSQGDAKVSADLGVALASEHRQAPPACVAGVPLCSRHTHLEHIGERPASRGKVGHRARRPWPAAPMQDRLGRTLARAGGRDRYRVKAAALRGRTLAFVIARPRFLTPALRRKRRLAASGAWIAGSSSSPKAGARRWRAGRPACLGRKRPGSPGLGGPGVRRPAIGMSPERSPAPRRLRR